MASSPQKVQVDPKASNKEKVATTGAAPSGRVDGAGKH